MDPARDVPERVQRAMQPGRLCVMFFGPAANKVRCVPQQRSLCWAPGAHGSRPRQVDVSGIGQLKLWLCILDC